MKTGFNKTERAAYQACSRIREGSGVWYFSIIWKRSATWGHNPNVHFRGEIVGKASGCGYDKESAALAEFLHFLPVSPDDQRAVWATSGCGFNSVVESLAILEWKLVKTYSGKTEDGYTIERI